MKYPRTSILLFLFSFLAFAGITGYAQAQNDGIAYKFKGDLLVAQIHPYKAGADLDSLLGVLGSSIEELEELYNADQSQPKAAMLNWERLYRANEMPANDAGWRVEKLSKKGLVFSKPIKDLKGTTPLKDCIVEVEGDGAGIASTSYLSTQGYNQLKRPSVVPDGDQVHYLLPGYPKAKQVYLAGSFNDWSNTATPMRHTAKGWEATIDLKPGKYLYKFVVDGSWELDRENKLVENDGSGNLNNVYFHPNYLFQLAGYPKAKKVYVAGSFNDWDRKELVMTRKGDHWEFPILLEQGTHTYKFIVDGKWMPDPNNPHALPDGYDNVNSVLSLGTTTRFELPGFKSAKQVCLAGDFNDWRHDELCMEKKEDVWAFDYVLKPGNFTYRYYVDGKWMPDPTNPHSIGRDKKKQSILTVEPNHSFELEGFKQAKEVFLTGNFNEWAEDGYAMTKSGDKWIMQMHLPPGKVHYKFIVDGAWVYDPQNPLWETNELGTKNSILWVK